MSRTTTRDRIERIGDYRVERELRSEDTGLVFRASHLLLPRVAELKVMHASHSWLRAAAVSVLREACLLEALSHPGIPRVYETGVLADKRPWSAFGFTEGTPLSQLGLCAVADLVPLLRDTADILAHAHARGVTHGRITWDNLLRVTDGRFPVHLRGWAEATAEDAPDAIPQVADVAALGAIAFRALTGANPNAGTTASLCPHAPVELTSLIDRMVARDVSAEEVRDCASWLAATVELMPTRPRWTPVHGLGADKLPPVEEMLSIRFGK